MKKLLPLAMVALFTLSLQAQKSPETAAPTLIIEASSMQEVPSLAEQMANGTFIEAEEINKEVNPKRSDANKAVPGKGLPPGPDPLWEPNQKSSKIKGKEPILVFTAASSGVTPTDPTGAVGPNHFVNSWNSAFRIWDKEGNALTSAASLGTIWPGQTAGDPIVMYDKWADRFIITQFTFSNGFLVAISQGPDPVNSGWYTYTFPTNVFPDYPKYSIWSDGYYITSNKNSGSAGFSEVVYAINRDKIIAGDPSAQMIGFPLPGITTSGFFSPLGFNVSGGELPPPGDAPIVYMQDDVWSGVSSDHLKIWNINVDWNTPSNSSISSAQSIPTTPFDGLFDGGSFSNLPQPSGPDIDALQATIMYMAQYRRFGGHNSVVLNFVVDLTGADNTAGIRWFELRQDNDGDPWTIYQEGTYAQPDGHSAFAGNMCIDADGNIGMAYSVVSSTQYVSLRYTGRFATDPLNEMTVAEETFGDGTMSDPSFRYGDYSQMTLDPEDEKSFWSIGEYFTGGTRKNLVGVFKLAPDLANDVGVVSIDYPEDGTLSDEETITVTVRNFGIDVQSNIPISFQVNGGSMVTETVVGPLASNNDVTYTFTATADLSTVGETYHIHASTGLGTDQNIENDTISKWVTHLHTNDVGFTQVIEPVSGVYLSDEETVTATIKNYGVSDQSNFEVGFSVDGGAMTTETFSGTLAMGDEMDYTFSNTADLSVIGEHTLMVSTLLSNDTQNINDTSSTMVMNSLCQPELMCTQGVGIWALAIGSVSNQSGCDPEGYGDYTNLTINVSQGSTNEVLIGTGHGDVHVRAWIDFNDNFLFEEEEIVIDDFVIAPGQTGGAYSESIPFTIPDDAAVGEHLMRYKANYDEMVPSDPCEETTFGEVEDYTVNVFLSTGMNDITTLQNDLIWKDLGNDQFAFEWNSGSDETGVVTVHNIQGNTVLRNRIVPQDGTYRFDFNMSFAPAGVYLMRIGNNENGKVKRFVVK